MLQMHSKHENALLKFWPILLTFDYNRQKDEIYGVRRDDIFKLNIFGGRKGALLRRRYGRGIAKTLLKRCYGVAKALLMRC